MSPGSVVGTMVSPRTRRYLDQLSEPALRNAVEDYVKQRAFRCQYCFHQIFAVMDSDGRTVRLNAESSLRKGTFVVVPNGSTFRTVELSANMSPGEFGATAGLELYTMHERSCGAPARKWWLETPRHLGRHTPALPEHLVWLRPSDLQVGDQVVVAIPPEEEPHPLPTPCRVTGVGNGGYMAFDHRERRWDDRARLQVRRPFTGTTLEILMTMCAMQALADAGCRCDIPRPEMRLGDQPMCQHCRTDSGFVKGLHRQRGLADTPRHISVVS